MKQIAEIRPRGGGVFFVGKAVFNGRIYKVLQYGEKPPGLSGFEIAERRGKVRRIVDHAHRTCGLRLGERKIGRQAEPAVGKIGPGRARERECAPDAGVNFQEPGRAARTAFELEHRKAGKASFLHNFLGVRT